MVESEVICDLQLQIMARSMSERLRSMSRGQGILEGRGQGT